MGCLTGKRETLPSARALRILAGAIAPATAPRCPLTAGGQSPRPAPDPPPAGAGLRYSRTCRSTDQPPARTGKRGVFPVFARRGGPVHSGMPGVSGRGHRPCHSATLPLASRGPKAPGQRPPRPRRALLARRVGRCPAVVHGPAGLRGTVLHGRGGAAAGVALRRQARPPSRSQPQGVLRSAGQGGPPESRFTNAWASGIWRA